ncbi:MAG: tRNA (pseudouridine(54)-N(1))-methyltransferase TrmY [Methanoregulaceae archaeon]|nr:tRNA (pseudouridine(54)-N(1))-methyltransferase TrmY [Methanoregulaceae archaeon]
MIRFAVLGHLAHTADDFSLNDMPGGAGRLDVLCRCVTTSLFLSHGMRRDVEVYLVLLGPPDPPRTILFSGENVRYLSPDERSAGSLIKKALDIHAGDEFRQSTPGVYVRKGGLEDLLSGHRFVLLDESGTDVRTVSSLPENYLLSDHMNLTEGEIMQTGDLPVFSVGPRALHADHTITVLQNELDRRAAGWTS